MLTRKQHDLLNFINKHLTKDGIPPSFDEMKEALDLRSKSGIHRLITALEERGFIRRLAHRARAIEIVKLPDSLNTNGKVTQLQNNLTAKSSGKVEADNQQLSNLVHAKELPVMGRIAAGVPIEAISQISHNVAVPGYMLRNGGDHYALEVKGDSFFCRNKQKKFQTVFVFLPQAFSFSKRMVEIILVLRTTQVYLTSFQQTKPILIYLAMMKNLHLVQ